MATDFGQSEPPGVIARAIADQTAKLSADTLLWMAAGAMAASVTIHMLGNKNVSAMVGRWVPVLLLFGLYKKLVTQPDSDVIESRA